MQTLNNTHILTLMLIIALYFHNFVLMDLVLYTIIRLFNCRETKPRATTVNNTHTVVVYICKIIFLTINNRKNYDKSITKIFSYTCKKVSNSDLRIYCCTKTSNFVTMIYCITSLYSLILSSCLPLRHIKQIKEAGNTLFTLFC